MQPEAASGSEQEPKLVDPEAKEAIDKVFSLVESDEGKEFWASHFVKAGKTIDEQHIDLALKWAARNLIKSDIDLIASAYGIPEVGDRAKELADKYEESYKHGGVKKFNQYRDEQNNFTLEQAKEAGYTPSFDSFQKALKENKFDIAAAILETQTAESVENEPQFKNYIYSAGIFDFQFPGKISALKVAMHLKDEEKDFSMYLRTTVIPEFTRYFDNQPPLKRNHEWNAAPLFVEFGDWEEVFRRLESNPHGLNWPEAPPEYKAKKDYLVSIAGDKRFDELHTKEQLAQQIAQLKLKLST